MCACAAVVRQVPISPDAAAGEVCLPETPKTSSRAPRESELELGSGHLSTEALVTSTEALVTSSIRVRQIARV